MTLEDPVNILLVDDQPAKLLSYEIILGGLGERLIKANSAREALECLLRNEIAVVLIDVCMPELDGFELAELIREHPRFQQISIIFVSAIQVSDLDSLRGYECGAVDYVPVPVVPEVLRAKVKVFAELFRKTRALERLNIELEERVRKRTAELEASAAALRTLNDELEYRIEERTSQREQALAQLFEAQKIDTIGQLTGGVAHDFNNLLMAVLGSLRLLKKQIPHDARAQRLLDNAVQGAERGAALTQRLLAFARRQELRPQVVDIGKLFLDIEDLLNRALGPGVTIDNQIPLGLTPVNVDANQLELAILNLAVNARDAMPSGGVLTINGRRRSIDQGEMAPVSPGAYIQLSVSDTGGGMDEVTLARATEPFFTTKGVGKGTGLGLSMVQGLAAQSGGTLELSSHPGVGTTCTLWLPEASGEIPTAQERPPTETSGVKSCASHVVLLVDDDVLVCNGTAAMLEDLGHKVIEANSADEALDVMRSNPRVDLVITDHAMPGMTGLELAQRLARDFPKLPVILASGYADLGFEDDGRGNFPRLTKPFRQEELAAILALAMERHVSIDA